MSPEFFMRRMLNFGRAHNGRPWVWDTLGTCVFISAFASSSSEMSLDFFRLARFGVGWTGVIFPFWNVQGTRFAPPSNTTALSERSLGLLRRTFRYDQFSIASGDK